MRNLQGQDGIVNGQTWLKSSKDRKMWRAIMPKLLTRHDTWQKKEKAAGNHSYIFPKMSWYSPDNKESHDPLLYYS